MNYSREEIMVVESARYINDRDVVFVGIGLPVISITLAKKTHAPNLMFVVESGSFDPLLKFLPLSVADSRVMNRASKLGSLRETLCCILQRGLVDVGFIGGAQIDQYANLNSTMIGDDYRHPKIRLVGSGGANDIASHAKRLMIVTRHEKRRFPKKCDYITSPGYIDGPDGRKKVGLKVTNPDIKIITDLAVMGIEPTLGKVKLLKLMPGITKDQVLDNMYFEPIIPPKLETVKPPTDHDLNLIRKEIDPNKVYLKGEE